MAKTQTVRKQNRIGWVRIGTRDKAKVIWYFYKNGAIVDTMIFAASADGIMSPKDKTKQTTKWDLINGKEVNISKKKESKVSKPPSPQVVSLIKAKKEESSSDQQILEEANSPQVDKDKEFKTPEAPKGEAKKTKKVGGQSLNQATPSSKAQITAREKLSEFLAEIKEEMTKPQQESNFSEKENESDSEITKVEPNLRSFCEQQAALQQEGQPTYYLELQVEGFPQLLRFKIEQMYMAKD